MRIPLRDWLHHPWRALLLTIAAACIATVPCTYYYARQRTAAIEYVRSTGGDVKFAPLPKWIPESIEIPEWLQSAKSADIRNDDSCDLALIAPLSELEELDCSGAITDQGFRSVGKLTKLKSACFFSHRVTDRGFAALRHCRRLERFELQASKISDEGLRTLSGMPLRELNLSHSRLTAAGVRHLAGLPLETLDLSWCRRLTDDCFPEIAKISTLKHLILEETRVTGNGIRSLAALPLEMIVLNWTPLTDEGLSEAADLPNLRLLLVSNTRITDAGLAALTDHPLEYLDIMRTKVTEEGVRAFRAKPRTKKLASDF